MGIRNRVKVVTASERRTDPIGVQQGDREWVTLIAAINAMGWAIAPYLIFKAKNHDASWYPDLKPQWRIGIQGRRVGSHVLLIIDGHESHKSLAFQNLCEENKIITLCMPPHSSHILQPLDVGCFAPLKRAYSKEIRVLALDHIGQIDKKAFLATFAKVFNKAFSKANILSSFRATGLVPSNPLVVLLKLDVKVRTPTPPL
ncbi:DDE-domain-containing protein, partial [Didymella exigua CBS 183.55]